MADEEAVLPPLSEDEEYVVARYTMPFTRRLHRRVKGEEMAFCKSKSATHVGVAVYFPVEDIVASYTQPCHRCFPEEWADGDSER